MDIIQKFLKSKRVSIVSSSEIKEGQKKPVKVSIFYAEHEDYFLNQEVELGHFKNIVQEIHNSNINKSQDSDDSYEEDYQSFVAQCDFIMQKFRWYITDERDVIFYEKTHSKALEFKYLTTDMISNKFYNCCTREEKEKLKLIMLMYNEEFPKKKIKNILDCFPILVRHLYTTAEFQFEGEPKTLSNSAEKPCFKFYDIHKLEKAGLNYEKKHGFRPPTPAWDEFFERIVEQDMVPVVKAFLAGLFMEQNTSKQVLYIRGDGNDGKTQIAKALMQEMGKKVSFLLPQNMKQNQFTSYDAYGKRFFVGEELHSPNVFKTHILHALTGGSPVRVERKGEQAFHTELYACGIITSNHKPEIEAIENQTSRILYIEMKRADDDKRKHAGNAWSQALRDEVRFMIYDGIRYFRELNPGGASYTVPESHNNAIEVLFDDRTTHIQQFVADAFEINHDGFIRANLGEAFRAYCSTNVFKSADDIPFDYKDNRTTQLVYNALVQVFPGIRVGQRTFGRQRIKCIMGIQLRLEGAKAAFLELMPLLGPPSEHKFKIASEESLIKLN